MQFVPTLFSGILRMILSRLYWAAAFCVVLSVLLATAPIVLMLFLISRSAFYRTLNFNGHASHPAP